MLSFIIPAYNEANQITEVVASVHESARLLGCEYEVIVVDDDSSDATAELAARAGAAVLSVNKRQIAAVRNAGAEAAIGDTLVFVDGDTFLNPITLSAAIDALNRGAVGGGAIIRFDNAPRTAHVAIAIAAFGLKCFGCCGGCFLFCTRSAFEQVGGFDENLFASEEITFAKVLGRVGRFIVLPVPVITSGRKVRRYSFTRLMSIVLGIGLRGPQAVRKRDGLDVWYDGVREAVEPMQKNSG